MALSAISGIACGLFASISLPGANGISLPRLDRES